MVQFVMETFSCSRLHPNDFGRYQACSAVMIRAKRGVELPEISPACKVSDKCAHVAVIRENIRGAGEQQKQAV